MYLSEYLTQNKHLFDEEGVINSLTLKLVKRDLLDLEDFKGLDSIVIETGKSKSLISTKFTPMKMEGVLKLHSISLTPPLILPEITQVYKINDVDTTISIIKEDSGKSKGVKVRAIIIKHNPNELKMFGQYHEVTDKQKYVYE